MEKDKIEWWKFWARAHLLKQKSQKKFSLSLIFLFSFPFFFLFLFFFCVLSALQCYFLNFSSEMNSWEKKTRTKTKQYKDCGLRLNAVSNEWMEAFVIVMFKKNNAIIRGYDKNKQKRFEVEAWKFLISFF